MCGRYTFSKPGKLKARYQLKLDYEMSPEYNVPPSAIMPVIIESDGIKKAVGMKWGLVPRWSKTPTVKFNTINARAETLATSSVYKMPFQRQRCLIPADGFYEWKKEADEKHKTPYFFHLKNDEIFSFAGLYDIWKDVEGKAFPTYTIITTTPNTLMEDVHNRMPVILEKESEEDWLNPDIVEPERLQQFLLPFPDTSMERYPVSEMVNSPRNNTAELLTPR